MAKRDRERIVASCLATLKYSRVKFDETKRIISKGNYGMGTWAAIDCLTHYHGYILTSGR